MNHANQKIDPARTGLSRRDASRLALLFLLAIATGCVHSNEELIEYNCSDSSCENSTVVCQPNDRLGCDPSSNVRWYDSCSQAGPIFKTCSQNASCNAIDDSYDCICHPSWYGDGESCLPCACSSEDLCCSNGCTWDAEHTSCTDTDPLTITESCTAYGQCIGTDYCDLHSCAEVVHTGQQQCYANNVAIGESCADVSICLEAYGEQADYCGQDGHHEPLTRQEQLTVISVGSDTDSDTDTRPGAAILDPHTGLMWSFEAGDEYERFSTGMAEARCDALTWGGLSWRLPTIREWLDVLNFENDALATPVEFAVERYPSEAVLYPTVSDSVVGDGSWGRWHVQVSAHDSPLIMGTLDHGVVLGAFATYYPDYRRVRCVSGDQQTIENMPERFTVWLGSLDPLVFDRATGLQWTKHRWPGATWQEALAYCENLNFGYWDDWKLPDINELSSLLDFTQDLPDSLFPFEPGDDLSQRCWSSTSSSQRPDHAWTVRLGEAAMETKNKDTLLDVRCVRR